MPTWPRNSCSRFLVNNKLQNNIVCMIRDGKVELSYSLNDINKNIKDLGSFAYLLKTFLYLLRIYTLLPHNQNQFSLMISNLVWAYFKMSPNVLMLSFLDACPATILKKMQDKIFERSTLNNKNYEITSPNIKTKWQRNVMLNFLVFYGG